MEMEGTVLSRLPASASCGGKVFDGKKQGLFDAFLTALLADLQPGPEGAYLRGEYCRLHTAICLQPGAEQNRALDEGPPALSGGTAVTQFLFWPGGTAIPVSDLPGDLISAGSTSADPGLSAYGDPVVFGQGNLKPAGSAENLLNVVLDGGRQTPVAQAAPWPQAVSDPAGGGITEAPMFSAAHPAGGGITEAQLFTAATMVESQKPVSLPLPDGQDPVGGGKPAAQPGATSQAQSQEATEMGEAGKKTPGQVADALSVLPETGKVFSVASLRPAISDQAASSFNGLFGEEPARGEVMTEAGALPEPELKPEQKAEQVRVERVLRPVDFIREHLQQGKTAPDRALPAGAGQAQPIAPPAGSPAGEVQISPPEIVKDASFKEQIMQQIQGRLLYIREKGPAPAEMRLRLQPAEWGEMVIRVFSRQGRLSALIQVEAAVMEILEGSLPELRQRLQQNNLTFEHLELFAAGREGFGTGYFCNERQRFDQGDPAVVQSIDPFQPEMGSVKTGGIEYWA